MTGNTKNQHSSDISTPELKRFGAAGIISILVILLLGNIFINNFLVPAGAILVLFWAKLSGTPWRDIGYAKPNNWVTTIAAGIIFGVMFRLLMKAIVMPILGADPINHTYHYLSGNRSMIPATLWTMIIVGFAEETIFRGFLFERMTKLLGTGLYSKIVTVLVTSALFAIAHYSDQGLPGVQQAIFTGLVFGTIYAFTKKIWMVMIAHSVYDLTAYAIIYNNLETDAAHLIFN